MGSQLVKLKWDISTEFQAATLLLDGGLTMRIDGESLHVPVFRNTETGDMKTASWMLGLQLGFDETSLMGRLKPAALDKAYRDGVLVTRPPLVIENLGAYTFDHDGASQGFARMWFYVEVTIKPHKGKLH